MDYPFIPAYNRRFPRRFFPIASLLAFAFFSSSLFAQLSQGRPGDPSFPRFTLSVERRFETGESLRDSEGGLEVWPNRPAYDSGETVTLTAIDNPEKGVVFVRWMPGGSTEKTIATVMEGDRSYTAVFREDFRVKKFYWFAGDEAQTESPFDPDELVTDIQILTLNPKPATYVGIEFTRPVDTGSVNGNLWVEELFERLDEKPLQRYESGTVVFRTWYNHNTMLKMLLHNRDADIAVIKNQVLAFHYTEGIVSALGTPLADPGVHRAATEIGSREEYLHPRYLPLAVMPSPALDRVRITFGLQMPDPVRVEVFDLLGQRVAMPADEVLDAGEHVVEWNAENVRSGVYRVRLTAGFNTESVPLIIE